MKFTVSYRKPIAAVLMAAMAAASVPVVPVHAAIVGTDQVIEQTQGTARDRVAAFMKREDVRQQLSLLGIASKEAEARVAALSDEEIDRIAGRIDELPSGQGAVGAIVGAAVLIFIVLLITDLIGLTSVFGFTKKGALNPN
ncbi:MAG: PA2779 family protein [Alphaproteobacteria bacterium]|nr:PA2779 family protein [Alphaproteobacteria bacterium]